MVTLILPCKQPFDQKLMQIKSHIIIKVSDKFGKLDFLCENVSKWKIEDGHLKDQDIASSTVFTACLYVKCDFLRFLQLHRFGLKKEYHDVTRTTILKKLFFSTSPT